MDRPLPTFLVERYWPGVDLATLRDALPRLEAAAQAMTAAGSRVVHVGSILMPVDEVVFSLIAARDEVHVRELNERAALPADRIAEAIAFLADVMARGGTVRVEPGLDMAEPGPAEPHPATTED
jgi:hypothetical protein